MTTPPETPTTTEAALIAAVEASYDIAELASEISSEVAYGDEHGVHPAITAGRTAFRELLANWQCERSALEAENARASRDLKALRREYAVMVDEHKEVVRFLGEIGHAVTSDLFTESDKMVIGQEITKLLSKLSGNKKAT
jgi:hypothetical protein